MSGGIAFPSSVNVGATHVYKNGEELLIYVYLGGHPQDVSSWFIVGGRTRTDPSEHFGANQIGSTWFDLTKNQQMVYTHSGVAGMSPKDWKEFLA